MTQRLSHHPDQQSFRDVQEVTSPGTAGFREVRKHFRLLNPYQLPGTTGGVVLVCGVGRGHAEVPGCATGVTSRLIRRAVPLQVSGLLRAQRAVQDSRVTESVPERVLQTGYRDEVLGARESL